MLNIEKENEAKLRLFTAAFLIGSGVLYVFAAKTSPCSFWCELLIGTVIELSLAEKGVIYVADGEACWVGDMVLIIWSGMVGVCIVGVGSEYPIDEPEIP